MVRIVLSAAACALVGACSSPPQAVMPDGSDRVPVNDHAQVRDYQAQVEARRKEASEREFLRERIAGLENTVARLRAYVALTALQPATPVRLEPAPAKAVSGDQAPAKPPPVVAAAANPVAAIASAPKVEAARMSGGAGTRPGAPVAGFAANESMEVLNASRLFRVSHAVGKADFNPSESLGAALLEAARRGGKVEIRGRTDAEHDTVVDQDIAMLRALRARRYLVDHGIEATKISMSFLASGGFVAPNNTSAGRAKNRRVEIETLEINTSDVGAAEAVAPAQEKM